MVCSAAAACSPRGVHDHDAAAVRPRTSTLSRPTPARAMTLSSCPRRSPRRPVGGRPDQHGVDAASPGSSWRGRIHRGERTSKSGRAMIVAGEAPRRSGRRAWSRQPAVGGTSFGYAASTAPRGAARSLGPAAPRSGPRPSRGTVIPTYPDVSNLTEHFTGASDPNASMAIRDTISSAMTTTTTPTMATGGPGRRRAASPRRRRRIG